MPRKIEDRGLEALGQISRDPVGGFMMRLLGPGVRRELKRAAARVTGFVQNVNGVIRDAEGDDEERDERKPPIVIDAEIVDETPRKGK